MDTGKYTTQLLTRPEIVIKDALTVNGSFGGNFDHCANMAKTLLEIVPQHSSRGMRMELTPSNQITDRGRAWDLTLKVSTVAWFDLDLAKSANKLQVALDYVSSERKAISQSRDDYVSDKGEVKVFQPENCIFGDNCKNKNTDKGCKYSHLSIKCKETFTRRGDGPRICGWTYSSKLGLLEPGRFILMVRPEPYRDLLLLPTPVNQGIQNALGHKTNVELASSSEFWESCFQKIQELVTMSSLDVLDPIQKIALNFGTWESAMSKDKKAIDCHGHGHIELTYAAASRLLSFYPQLIGRTGTPEDYRELNCSELELGRLISLQLHSMCQEISHMNEKVTNLETIVGTISKKLDDILSLM